MTKEILDHTKKIFDELLAHLKGELIKIRTSRAQTALIEDIPVEYYGSKLRMKELATITIPSPQMIHIEPWDKGGIDAIVGAIRASHLGIEPTVDGTVVRLFLPMLTEERRNELRKLVGAKLEETRIALRQRRDEAWKKIQELEHAHQISQDDKFRAKDELQRSIEEYNEKIKELEEQKGSEIMSV